MTRTLHPARLAAAVLVTAAAGLVGLAAQVASAPQAAAATCSTTSGVSVVVDPGALGGAVSTACVADGAGHAASSLFPEAGHPLDYVQNQPGFVCRVDSAPSPSQQACVNTPSDDAYWGLWWSDGQNGTWNYSNYGVGSLKVPDGAYVALAWQTGSRRTPALTPAPHAAAPTAAASTSAPSTGASSGPGRTPTRKPRATAGASKPPSATPSTKPSAPASADVTFSSTASPALTLSSEPTPSADASAPSASSEESGSSAPASTAPETSGAPASVAPSASVVASDGAVTTASPPDPTDPDGTDGPGGALPRWVVPVVLLGLLAAGAGVYADRRRRAAGPGAGDGASGP